MPFPRVTPHSDGAGVIDAVGPGVDGSRVRQRVWVYGAQSYRPFGTAAQFTTVPEFQAVPCPDSLSDESWSGISRFTAPSSESSGPATAFTNDAPASRATIIRSSAISRSPTKPSPRATTPTRP